MRTNRLIDEDQSPQPKRTLEELVQSQNVHLAMSGSRLRWSTDGHSCHLRDTTPQDRPPPLSDAQLRRAYEHLGDVILQMGIKCGDITEERANRIRYQLPQDQAA